MALTLEAEQRLDSVGLVGLFDDSEAWLEAAKQTKGFIEGDGSGSGDQWTQKS